MPSDSFLFYRNNQRDLQTCRNCIEPKWRMNPSGAPVRHGRHPRLEQHFSQHFCKSGSLFFFFQPINHNHAQTCTPMHAATSEKHWWNTGLRL